MSNAGSSFFDIEKDLSSAVNRGDGFNIYEIIGSKIIEEKNMIDYGGKVSISFLKNFINPEIGLGLRLNLSEIKEKNVKQDFYFIGRKNSSTKYSNPLLFQDKSLLNERQVKFRDFYFGGNVYGCFFNTGFNFKKLTIFDNEMASAVNSFLDSCSCSFSKNINKSSVDTTVLDLSQKMLNLNIIFGYDSPFNVIIDKIISKKIEKALFNCPRKMYSKVLNNFLAILANNMSVDKNIKIVEVPKDGTFSIRDISDFYIEYKERKYYQSNSCNSFFIVKGKNNKIFLLDFFNNNKIKFSKVNNVLKSYSELASNNEFFIKAFSTEIFINEK